MRLSPTDILQSSLIGPVCGVTFQQCMPCIDKDYFQSLFSTMFEKCKFLLIYPNFKTLYYQILLTKTGKINICCPRDRCPSQHNEGLTEGPP